jgi:hypothetical protein
MFTTIEGEALAILATVSEAIPTGTFFMRKTGNHPLLYQCPGSHTGGRMSLGRPAIRRCAASEGGTIPENADNP